MRVRLRVDREGRRIRRRGRRRDAAAVEGAEGAAWPPSTSRAVYETLERPLVPVLAPHGRPRHFHRPPGAVAAVGRVRAEAGRPRGRDQQACRPAAQSRQPEATGRRAVRLDGPAGRHQDQDRAMGDRRARAGGAGRAGPRAAAENSRLAAGVEAALDLHRRAAGLRQRRDPPRPHQLRAGRDHDRPAVVIRAEPAEHPGPHRGGPQDPPRLHRRAGHQARLRRLFADRAAAAGRGRRSAGAAARRSATASTSTP